jgi:hypothetical protein
MKKARDRFTPSRAEIYFETLVDHLINDARAATVDDQTTAD